MSDKQIAPHRWVKVLGLSSALLLAACGGGGGSSGSGGGAETTPPPGNTETPPPSTAPVVVSGTAAAGAPLKGTVTVKDSKGAVKSVDIGTDGGYQVDVTDMTPPLLFRAQGTVGGRTYVLHSAASAEDLSSNATINVTPFTDLIVANIAQQVAANYFENGNFSGLTQEQLNAGQNALRERLQTVLSALGVESSIDLLRTSFAADHSGIDAALDLLRVTVDPNTQVATITNLLNNEAITDDLTRRDDATALANVSGVMEGATDLQRIVALFSAVSDMFAGDLPSEEQVSPYVDENFLDNDDDKAALIVDITTDEEMEGLAWTNLVIDRLDPAEGFATVSFDLMRGSTVVERVVDFQLRREGEAWLLYGNRLPFDIELYAHAVKTFYGSDVPNIQTGIEPWVEDNDLDNNGGTVTHMVVRGPGFPADGLVYLPQPTGGTFLIQGDNTPWYIMGEEDDEAIKAIPDNAEYTITFYDSSTELLEVKRILPRRPYTNKEVTDGESALFPRINLPTPAQVAMYNGGAMNVTASVPSTAGAVWMQLSYSRIGGEYNWVEVETTVTDGVASETIVLPVVGDNSIEHRNLRVDYDDEFARTLMTSIIAPGGT